MCQETFRQGKT
uniref:Uncharacterized protein n=1 Tax=Arundo donax TaxID=35708 RepID=A0A0A9I0J2_ARUDO